MENWWSPIDIYNYKYACRRYFDKLANYPDREPVNVFGTPEENGYLKSSKASFAAYKVFKGLDVAVPEETEPKTEPASEVIEEEVISQDDDDEEEEELIEEPVQTEEIQAENGEAEEHSIDETVDNGEAEDEAEPDKVDDDAAVVDDSNNVVSENGDDVNGEDDNEEDANGVDADRENVSETLNCVEDVSEAEDGVEEEENNSVSNSETNAILRNSDLGENVPSVNSNAAEQTAVSETAVYEADVTGNDNGEEDTIDDGDDNDPV